VNNALAAGAIGVVVGNNDTDASLISMALGTAANTIPAVFIGGPDKLKLRSAIQLQAALYRLCLVMRLPEAMLLLTLTLWQALLPGVLHPTWRLSPQYLHQVLPYSLLSLVINMPRIKARLWQLHT